ncbi:MAG: methyltransferase [Kiritimatiellae bacterium]|jgi:ubiquinone/menaquinone biosynthesis C-methylase UbiE|nr:methyltransferase [Kiritimatiellia bacterium]
MSEKELSVQGIVDCASAYYRSAILFAALEHDVFSKIESASESGATLDVVAGLCEADLRGMRLLLDGCVATGLLRKTGQLYFNSDAGRSVLIKGSPNDLGKAIGYNRDVYTAWGELAKLVKSGCPVEDPEVHLGRDDGRTNRFVLSMHGRALGIGRAVVPVLDLKGCSRLLDLAGGPGTYAVMMAEANSGLSCVTVDLPAVSKVASSLVAQSSAAEMVECRAGDYHSDVYEENGYDVVTIFGALHQESSEMIVDILKRANAALKPGGRIYILDMMTDETHASPQFSALFAVNMALTTDNGWVFSDKELYGWLEEAGFENCHTKNVAPPMPHWLVSAVKSKPAKPELD